jgi:hypothetical protein
LLLAAGPARGQDALTVPASSDVYRRLEAVSAFFPVPLHLGLRPQSRRSVKRAVERLEAAVRRSSADHPRREWALRELERITAGFAAEDGSSPAALTAWQAVGFASNARIAAIDSNGLGTLDAREHAFSPMRWGMDSPDGGVLSLQPTASAATGRYALLAMPALDLTAADSAAGADVFIRRAYARARLSNVALRLGLDEMLWGQAPRGALFISGHAPAFPAITVSSDTAFVLPWLLRYAGPVQAVLMLADLGPTQTPSHARLAGWQVSIQPWSRFELGVAVLTHTGGQGGPPATFLERVVDLFPVIDALAPHPADLQISNKIAGGNLRWRIPELSGLDVYYELAIDDFDGRRLAGSFVDDFGHLIGARVARGPVVWRAEWHRTSIRLYEHAQFRSGLTYRQRLIGSPLGPHARAGYIAAEFPLGHDGHARLALSDERRDPSQYTVAVSGERDRGFRFIRLSDDPDFRRLQAVAEIERDLRGFAVNITAGANRAWRNGGAARLEWLGQIGVRSRTLSLF